MQLSQQLRARLAPRLLGGLGHRPDSFCELLSSLWLHLPDGKHGQRADGFLQRGDTRFQRVQV